jgi:hypothetical protein
MIVAKNLDSIEQMKLFATTPPFELIIISEK